MQAPKPQPSLISTLHGPFGRISLGATTFTIGRATDNQLVLNDSQISSHHAKIYPEGERYFIVDLDSLNGTFVNGHRLTPEVPHSLHPNEQIRFGQNTSNPETTLIYQVVGVEPVEPTCIAPPVSPTSNPVVPQARSRPAIRDIIAGQTDYKPSPGMSSTELVDLLAPLTALPSVPIFILLKGAEILFKAVGGKETNRLKKVFPGPYEYPAIVLAFALAFRKTEQEIISLYDTAHGSVIEGKLPNSLLSLGEGTITIEFIDESPASITVDVIAEIKGEDWGKGKHAVEEVFECAENYVRRITGGTIRHARK